MEVTLQTTRHDIAVMAVACEVLLSGKHTEIDTAERDDLERISQKLRLMLALRS